MGPRRAGIPPQYSSTPPRPPDPGNLRMKLQVELEETTAGFGELQKSMASMATEQAVSQSEILQELRQLRLERTAQVMEPSMPTSSVQIISPAVTQPISSTLQFWTTSDPYYYQQQQPPPPPPSRPPALHQQQRVWYSNQNQYQCHTLQPPSPPQQWVRPPHANQLPPSLGHYHPPSPPHYSPHYYPQSNHPQQLNHEWGAQSWPTNQGWEYLAHYSEQDWAQARAWAARTTMDCQDKQSQYTPAGQPEEQSESLPSSQLVSSPIMTMGSIQAQAIGCFSTMEECLSGNSLTLPTESTLLFSPALVVVDSVVSISRDKGKMIDDDRNCNLGTSLGTNKLTSGALKSGEGGKERQQLSTVDMAACMVKKEHFGSKIGKNDEPTILGSLSQQLESIESVSSLPPPSIQTSSGPAQLMSPTRSLVPKEGDVVKKKTSELTVRDNISTMVGNYFQCALHKCYGYEKEISTCVVNVFNELCIRLKHYIEGSKKTSYYVLQLCFFVFDKKVRDKGGGHNLSTDEFFIMNKEFARNIRLLQGYISYGIEFKVGFNLEYKWETKGSGDLIVLASPLHVKLLKNDVLVSNKLYVLVKELGKALAILPVSLLKIMADIREQIEVLHWEVKGAELCVDLKDVKMREELLVLMGSNNERNKKNKGFVDLVIEEVIDFLQINLEFSSSRCSYGLVAPITTLSIQSVGKKHILDLLLAVLCGNVSHVFETLSFIPVNKPNYKKESLDVICLATIIFVAYVLSLHVQLVEKCMSPQIVEFTQHYVTKKELVIFWIWVPTTLSSSKDWILNSHGLIVIKAYLSIGDIFLIRELMFDIEFHITPTRAVATGLVDYSSEDLHTTNSDSHMAHFNMCLWHTKAKVKDIISSICLRSSMNYEDEISKLEAEAQKQTWSSGLIVVCNLNNLISFVSNYSSMVFVDNDFETTNKEDFKLLGSTHCNGYYDHSSSSQSIIANISDELRFPKSGKKLIHVSLVPKSLLHQCSRSWIIPIIFIFFYISAGKAADDTMKLAAEFLVIEKYLRDATESWLDGTLGRTLDKSHWYPKKILDRDMFKKGNSAEIKWLVQWENSVEDDATWMNTDEFMKKFPESRF